jgi:integrase
MPTIRQRGGQFHVQIRMAGFPSRTASFPTRRLAERWAKTIEAEMIEGRHFRHVGARRRTLAEAIERYLLEEVPKKADARTRTARLRWWQERLGHLKLGEVTAAVIIEQRGVLSREPYVRAGGENPNQFKRGPATVNRYLAYLSHVFTIARREWHWIGHDPFDGVGKFEESKGRIRYLTEDERERLLAETAKDSQLHVLVVLALSTAARAGELAELRWQDVELNEARALLRDTKNGESRTVWLHGEALKLLREHRGRHLDPERVFVSEQGKTYSHRFPFEEACQRAKLSNFHFHDLRHSAATYLARMGATEQQLKAIGGWKSNVVSRYVHLAAEDARAVLERMNNQILGSKKP